MKEFKARSDSIYFIDTNIWLYSFIQSQHTKKTKIARAIIQDCDADFLISEDMQNNFNLENKFTIVNPFS
jgi:predicted nucleic acid-binding protein